MDEKIAFGDLDEALRRCGSGWTAAQAHGLLVGCLATAGAQAGPGWLLQVLQDTDERDAARQECVAMLDALYQASFWDLSERFSEFAPLLPADDAATEEKAVAMAHWCEGFLHGLVSTQHAQALKDRLAAEPLADIIRDMLQITRAAVDEESDAESNESAYAELYEYIRVAAQLAYEELSDIRHAEET